MSVHGDGVPHPWPGVGWSTLSRLGGRRYPGKTKTPPPVTTAEEYLLRGGRCASYVHAGDFLASFDVRSVIFVRLPLQKMASVAAKYKCDDNGGGSNIYQKGGGLFGIVKNYGQRTFLQIGGHISGYKLNH